MPLTLPIEVCERVIDFASGNRRLIPDAPTFHSCCLVCRAWVPTSRLHLYTSVWLSPHNLTQFTRAISFEPLNGLLVRMLLLSDDPDGMDHHKLSLVPLQLPQLLPNLRIIRLYNIRLADLHPKFFTYLSRFRSVHAARVSVRHCPTIMQLARYLTAFPRLYECKVSLGSSAIKSLSFPGARLPTKRIVVPKLWLLMPCNLQLAGPTLDIFSPSSVRSLHIEFLSTRSLQDEIVQLVASFVTRCADALSELKLNYCGWDFLDLSQKTSLVSLDLSMFGVTSGSNATANLRHRSTLSRMLSTICSAQLKKLRLGILIVSDSKGAVSPLGWDALDATLALPTLREVKYISIKVEVIPSGEIYEGYPASRHVSERTVRQLLPRLAARSGVDFSPSEVLLEEARDLQISWTDKQDALKLETVDSEASQLDN